MNYKTKKKENAAVEIRVKHTAEEVEEAYRESIDQARRKLKLPGFRKGKVPFDLAEKHLGESVAGEAARRLIAGTVRSIVAELDPPPISMPQFNVESFERGKGASYVGTYDTRPEVKLGKYRKRKLVLEQLQVTDADVDARLAEMQKQHASLRTREEGEPGGDDDLFTLDLAIREGDDELYHEKEFRYKPSGGVGIPDLKDRVVGAKIGDSGSYQTDFPTDFPERKFAGKNLTVEHKVVRIEVTEKPELNDDFAAEVGEYENLSALRDSLRGDLETQGKEALRKRAMGVFIDEVIADSKYVIPSSLVEQEMERRLQSLKGRLGAKELTIEDLAGYTKREVSAVRTELEEAASAGIRRDMTLMEIAQKEGITVADSDVDDAIRGQFGAMLPPEQLENWMQQESIRDNVEGSLLYERTVAWLFEHADVKNGRQVTHAEATAGEHDHG